MNLFVCHFFPVHFVHLFPFSLVAAFIILMLPTFFRWILLPWILPCKVTIIVFKCIDALKIDQCSIKLILKIVIHSHKCHYVCRLWKCKCTGCAIMRHLYHILYLKNELFHKSRFLLQLFYFWDEWAHWMKLLNIIEENVVLRSKSSV